MGGVFLRTHWERRIRRRMKGALRNRERTVYCLWTAKSVLKRRLRSHDVAEGILGGVDMLRARQVATEGNGECSGFVADHTYAHNRGSSRPRSAFKFSWPYQHI